MRQFDLIISTTSTLSSGERPIKPNTNALLPMNYLFSVGINFHCIMMEDTFKAIAEEKSVNGFLVRIPGSICQVPTFFNTTAVNRATINMTK